MAVSELPIILSCGCGLDVHKDTVVASIKGRDIEAQTKTFSIFTDDLYLLAGWLQDHGISHIAMESTGIQYAYQDFEDFNHNRNNHLL